MALEARVLLKMRPSRMRMPLDPASPCRLSPVNQRTLLYFRAISWGQQRSRPFFRLEAKVG